MFTGGGNAVHVNAVVTPAERECRLAVTLPWRGGSAVAHSSKGQFARELPSVLRVSQCIKTAV